MVKIKFVKYNKTRKEEFQIKTSILEDNGIPYVEKSALRPEGSEHIASFVKKYTQLSEQNTKIKMIRPELSEDRMSARFEFLEGETVAQRLGKSIKDGQAPVEIINNALDEIYAVSDNDYIDFTITPEFTEVFGEDEEAIDGLCGDSFRISNIDGLFDNFMITQDGTYGLDYEWVFDFPIPSDFVKYRTLYYFYQEYCSLMNYKCCGDFLEEFGIDSITASKYSAMELSFQHYVHGDNQRIFLENFMHPVKTVKDLARIDEDHKQAKERIEQLKLELKEKDTTIHKIQEVQRLTNNHVTNLEIIIANLRREVEEQGKTLTYLNRHEAVIFKVRRKIAKKFNTLFPQGTRKRKIISYAKNTLIHPLKYIRLYTTEEGRNLIEGDFKVGEDYLAHGKLRFKKEEKPRVSVVIPVYNQIHYTYACLVSILEYTKDVSYEIIIADDVSSDATAQLSDFAENIIICRNKTNQGFLRNCNQAAKAARGKYIMFLNNDTKVTEGWLSSLVNLIESDETIGMVGSKLVYPDGRLQEAGGIIWSDGSGWNYGRLDNPDKPEYNYVKDVDYISGAAILLSVELWKQIGGFDERFAPAYCEDSDLAFEVRRAGKRVVYQPLSKVIHFEGISNGTDVNGEGLKRYQVENSGKLKEKWADELKKQCENTGNPSPFNARERSMGKKIILVVDHYVPTFDRDAGSKTTYQYLKMFINKGYIVKFLGDNFLHEEPYSTQLQQMGIEILYGQEYQASIWDWLKTHSSEISFAYLNRPHIASKYIDFIIENTDIKVIYYGHDLHFLREGREYALTGNEEKRQASEYWKSIEIALMRKASVSYYPSYIEEEAIKEIDSDINVKAITAYVYDEFKTALQTDFAKREGLLFVGGFAHPPNADAVLWFAEEIYPLIRQKLEVPFYIVGSKVTEEIQALEKPGNGIIVKGFVSDEELGRLYEESKIVVVPLRYGAGVKGKVIEAIYNGAPVITTSIGAEGIPDAGQVMIVRDKPEEFAREVISLYSDNEGCRRLAESTQSYIRRYFSVDAAWNVIEEDFKR